jgi:hypothetical protein
MTQRLSANRYRTRDFCSPIADAIDASGNGQSLAGEGTIIHAPIQAVRQHRLHHLERAVTWGAPWRWSATGEYRPPLLTHRLLRHQFGRPLPFRKEVNNDVAAVRPIEAEFRL